jgi:hypothetical protein
VEGDNFVSLRRFQARISDKVADFSLIDAMMSSTTVVKTE